MNAALSSLENRYRHLRCRSLAPVAAVALTVFAAACPPSVDSASSLDAGAEPTSPPQIVVSETRQDLAFTYRDPKTGAFTTATARDEVPVAARSAVVVTDLSLTPEQRQAGRYVYVTDLRAPREDGTFPVAVASRYGFEAMLTSTATVVDGQRGEVVVYSASWCGVCRTTKRLLKQWRVPFVDKDIEASKSARDELVAKAARAGIRPGGVPVIDVGGLIMAGLDERALRDALVRKGFL